MREVSAVMLDGEKISKYVDILQGVVQRCTLSPNLFKIPGIYINNLLVAVEAARRSHGRGRYGVGIDVCG